MDPTAFLEGRTRETEIRRDRQGRWWNGAEPISHPGLARAFDAWIERAPDGRYCLRNDINWAYVTIEGAPVFVRACRPDADGVVLGLSDGREERLAPESLRQAPSGELYCTVRGGTLAARFDPHAAVQLSELVEEDEAGPYLVLGGRVVRPPVVADPLATE